MKLLIRIKIRSRMNSVESESEEIPSLSETAADLFPIVNDISNTMLAITEKIEKCRIGWIQNPVEPVGEPMKELFSQYGFSTGATVNSLLIAVLDDSKSLDLETRMIHFSDDVGKILQRPSMSIFEFLHFAIDSVAFV